MILSNHSDLSYCSPRAFYSYYLRCFFSLQINDSQAGMTNEVKAYIEKGSSLKKKKRLNKKL
jgi:hypothetical protein